MGSFLIAFTVIAGGIVASAFAKILADEFKAWRPNMVHRLIAIAASLLSGDDRERYQEEWSAYVEEVPGDLGKLLSASGFVWAAARMSDRRFMVLGMKRVMDLGIAVPALLACGPMLLIIGVAIKLESPGPIFFAHRRQGKAGKEIQVYKFRSTHLPSGDQSPQLTRIGRVIRLFSWDELPQLFNILKGDMSIVGPRPFPAYIPNDEEEARLMKARQTMRPGLTGLGQLLRSNRRDHFRDSLRSDLFYVTAHSILLDIFIILKTASVAFGPKANFGGAFCAMMFALTLPAAMLVGVIAALWA